MKFLRNKTSKLLSNSNSHLLKADKALQCPEAKSVAGGLAPPFQGENAFYHVRAFVEDILLVCA